MTNELVTKVDGSSSLPPMNFDIDLLKKRWSTQKSKWTVLNKITMND